MVISDWRLAIGCVYHTDIRRGAGESRGGVFSLRHARQGIGKTCRSVLACVFCLLNVVESVRAAN